MMNDSQQPGIEQLESFTTFETYTEMLQEVDVEALGEAADADAAAALASLEVYQMMAEGILIASQQSAGAIAGEEAREISEALEIASGISSYISEWAGQAAIEEGNAIFNEQLEAMGIGEASGEAVAEIILNEVAALPPLPDATDSGSAVDAILAQWSQVWQRLWIPVFPGIEISVDGNTLYDKRLRFFGAIRAGIGQAAAAGFFILKALF